MTSDRDQTPFRIRPGQPSDLAPLLALERSIPTAPHWTEADYLLCFEVSEDSRVRRQLFIAESSSTQSLQGFAIGKLVSLPIGDRLESEAELESVAVNPAARRLGIGLSLCKAVCDWGADAGATSIDLEVRSGSSAAIGLYQGIGFTPYAIRSNYYRDPVEDAVLMRLPLNSGTSQSA